VSVHFLKTCSERIGDAVKITIDLPDGLYTELLSASAEVKEIGFQPKHWAQEAVQSALAARRLPRMAAAIRGTRARITDEPEPKTYGLLWPERH
jgi:hypothetical protein